jgi:hypothetical protein
MTTKPLIVRLGGAHGNLQARWEFMATNTWRLMPDPGLGAEVIADYGPYLGEVAFDRALRRCQIAVRSRHGRAWQFEEPAATPEDARKVLEAKIGAAAFNPMWVNGHDDLSRLKIGPADDMSASTRAPNDYALEWGDRMGSAVNHFDEAYARPALNAVANGRVFNPRQPALEARAHLENRCTQLRDVFKRGLIPLNSREGQRVHALLQWGLGLLSVYDPLPPQAWSILPCDIRNSVIAGQGRMAV